MQRLVYAEISELSFEYCDAASGNYTLASDSPCAITVSPCGQIGALGVACGSTSVDSESFARIKAAWRTRTPGRD